jgi:hypothetical protein
MIATIPTTTNNSVRVNPRRPDGSATAVCDEKNARVAANSMSKNDDANPTRPQSQCGKSGAGLAAMEWGWLIWEVTNRMRSICLSMYLHQGCGT